MIRLCAPVSPATYTPSPTIGAARAYSETAGLIVIVFGPAVLNAMQNGWKVVTGAPPDWMAWWTQPAAVAATVTMFGLGLIWLAALLPWRRIRPDILAAGLTSLISVMAAALAAGRRAPGLADALFYLDSTALAVALAAAIAYRRHLTPAAAGLGRIPGPDRLAGYTCSRNTAISALAGFAVASLVARAIVLIPGVPAPPAGFAVNGLHNLATMTLASINAGVCEELILIGVLVTALEAARRPVWEVYATSLAARVAIHLYFGVAAPAALIMAAANVWLYRRTRRLLPLVIAHIAVDQLGAIQAAGGPFAIPLVSVTVWALDAMITRRLARHTPTPQEQTQP